MKKYLLQLSTATIIFMTSVLPASALTVTNITTTNFSNDNHIQSSGNSITREYRSATTETLPATTSGAVTSFGSKLAFFQGMRVNQPAAPNFALIYRHNIGYQIEFTVEDPNNEGYVLQVDQAMRGCIAVSREEPIRADMSVGLLLGRIDANDGNGPIHYSGFYESGGGVVVQGDNPDSVQRIYVDKTKTFNHAPVYTGTRTFVVSFSSFPSPALVNIFQNYGGGEGMANFGLAPTFVGSGTTLPGFQYTDCPEATAAGLGHFGTISVISQNPPDECIPSAEICDGIDNDCDDEIDEDFNVGDSCSTGLGACAAEGGYVCSDDGLSTECNAVAGEPTAEVCDNLDNDCDGTVDDVDTDGDGVLECGSADMCIGAGDDSGMNLKPNHYAQLDDDDAFEVGCSGKNCTPVDSNITLADTFGCTCGQIIDALPGKKKGLLKFGCTDDIIQDWINQ